MRDKFTINYNIEHVMLNIFRSNIEIIDCLIESLNLNKKQSDGFEDNKRFTNFIIRHSRFRQKK